MDDEKFCLWAIGIAIILFAAIFGMTKYDDWKADRDDDDKDEVILIREGDEISVDYTGYFQSGQGELGAVFDTSRNEIAGNASIPKSTEFQNKGVYDDLTFTVGSGQMIKGFDNAVLGKKVGQSFTVSILPDDAYGPSFDEMVYYLNTTQTIPLYQTMTREEFQAIFGEIENPLGLVLTHPIWNWQITVTKADPTEVTFMNQPIYGDAYSPFDWNTTVEDISTERGIITIHHHTEDINKDTRVPTMVLTGFDSEWFQSASSIEQWDEMGMGRVILDGEYIVIDFNKEVAGKTLVFEIQINSINRGE